MDSVLIMRDQIFEGRFDGCRDKASSKDTQLPPIGFHVDNTLNVPRYLDCTTERALTDVENELNCLGLRHRDLVRRHSRPAARISGGLTHRVLYPEIRTRIENVSHMIDLALDGLDLVLSRELSQPVAAATVPAVALKERFIY